jgi:hypothetical protein
MAVTTGYYIQRLSDGKILAGNGGLSGANSELGDFDPANWFELTNSGQLNTQAYWVIVDLAQNYSTYSWALEQTADSLPQSNGDWQQDLFRFLPIQKNV